MELNSLKAIKKRRRKRKKRFYLLITALKSYHNQQYTLFIIKAYNSPQIRPLLIILSYNSRGGYPEAPFRTIFITAISRSFKVIADFQQTNKLLKNR
jgi:hypothetical protein